VGPIDIDMLQLLLLLLLDYYWTDLLQLLLLVLDLALP
jgi:hypothetical protein